MSGTPFMQLYVGDYLSDTLELTTEQHGAYLLILMTMWGKGAKLTNDPVKLARIARMTPAKFKAAWAEISRFFEDDGDCISNPRMTRDWEKTQEKITKRAKAGSAGGTAKALKDKQAHVANAMRMPCHSSESEPEKKEVTDVTLSVSPTLPAVQPKDAGPSFSEFWSIWPLGKISKQAAEKAFKKLSAADRSLAIDRAVSWSAQWQRSHPNASPIHPASYLNAKRWTDETQPNLTLIPGGPRDQFARDDRSSAARTNALRHQINVAAGMQRTPREDCF